MMVHVCTLPNYFTKTYLAFYAFSHIAKEGECKEFSVVEAVFSKEIQAGLDNARLEGLRQSGVAAGLPGGVVPLREFLGPLSGKRCPYSIFLAQQVKQSIPAKEAIDSNEKASKTTAYFRRLLSS